MVMGTVTLLARVREHRTGNQLPASVVLVLKEETKTTWP